MPSTERNSRREEFEPVQRTLRHELGAVLRDRGSMRPNHLTDVHSAFDCYMPAGLDEFRSVLNRCVSDSLPN